MGDRKTIRLDSSQNNALSSMVEDDEAENESEAARHAMNVGLADLGYLNGSGHSYLVWLLRRVATAFIYVGVGAAAVFFFFPVGFRLIALVPIASGLTAIALAVIVERYLEDHREPAPSPGGEKA